MTERRSDTRVSRSTKSRSESRLHEELKHRYAEALGGRVEQTIEGLQVDVLKDRTVVEIQVGKLGALKPKMRFLSSRGYSVRVVLPIQAVLTTPVRVRTTGVSHLRTRRRKASFLEAFRELVHFPDILSTPVVSLELLLLHEQRLGYTTRETVWRGGKPRSKLLNAFQRDTTVVEVLDRRQFETNADLLGLLPAGLPGFFTNQDLAKIANVSYTLASMTTYALTQVGVLRRAGRHGGRNVYSLSPPS